MSTLIWSYVEVYHTSTGHFVRSIAAPRSLLIVILYWNVLNISEIVNGVWITHHINYNDQLSYDIIYMCLHYYSHNNFHSVHAFIITMNSCVVLLMFTNTHVYFLYVMYSSAIVNSAWITVNMYYIVLVLLYNIIYTCDIILVYSVNVCVNKSIQ